MSYIRLLTELEPILLRLYLQGDRADTRAARIVVEGEFAQVQKPLPLRVTGNKETRGVSIDFRPLTPL